MSALLVDGLADGAGELEAGAEKSRSNRLPPLLLGG